MMFQSCFEEWDQDVQKILFRLVKGAEVHTPRHISHDADSGVSKFRHDAVSLSVDRDSSSGMLTWGPRLGQLLDERSKMPRLVGAIVAPDGTFVPKIFKF